MKKMKLISLIFRYILLAFVILNSVWYGVTGFSFFKSKFLFFGTIVSGLIYLVSYISYLILAKNYKELKQFFLFLIIATAAIYLFGFLLEKL